MKTIISNGTNALGGAIIVSDSSSNFFTVTIVGTNSESFDIFCSNNDTCEIMCVRIVLIWISI